MELYQADFDAERESRGNLASEKEQLVSDIRALHKRNEELLAQIQRFVSFAEGEQLWFCFLPISRIHYVFHNSLANFQFSWHEVQIKFCQFWNPAVLFFTTLSHIKVVRIGLDHCRMLVCWFFFFRSSTQRGWFTMPSRNSQPASQTQTPTREERQMVSSRRLLPWLVRTAFPRTWKFPQTEIWRASQIDCFLLQMYEEPVPSPQKYYCPICNFEFKQLDILNHHIEGCLTNWLEVICQFAPSRLPFPGALFGVSWWRLAPYSLTRQDISDKIAFVKRIS